MKKIKIKNCLLFIITAFSILFAAIFAFSSQQGITQRLKYATKVSDNTAGIETAIFIPKNIIKAQHNYQGGEFFIESRKNMIERYKCSSCHNDKEVMVNNAARISHADIKVVHGDKDNPLDCNSCHSKENRDFLENSKGEKIDMDHSYNMCGQCHFRQRKDWTGGAHGKRLTYWAGERVIKNCASCHNPHAPRFEKRWPSTYSVPLK